MDRSGGLADHLCAAGDETVRQALATGRTIRRGQGHSLRIAAPAADTAGPAAAAHSTSTRPTSPCSCWPTAVWSPRCPTAARRLVAYLLEAFRIRPAREALPPPSTLRLDALPLAPTGNPRRGTADA
ncbi:hypothetical protein ACGF12_36460 [Kitasatospora sp. NPDC048296]|uniref:hypothetical protein n=1 Tax=Kitasatospora sp. NPDC048296 TaxID=3364048 RepID=UPI0037125B6F